MIILYIPLALATNNPDKACYLSAAILAPATAACTFAANTVGDAVGLSVCAVGLGIVGFSLMHVCITQSDMLQPKSKHLLPNSALPAIAHVMANGTLVDLSGDRMHHISPLVLEKREIPGQLEWPEYGPVDLNAHFYTSLGNAAEGKLDCKIPGRQVCVQDQRAFITCSRQHKWVLMQACGSGYTCQPHPTAPSRIVCSR